MLSLGEEKILDKPDIQKRTYNYSVQVVKLAKSIKRDDINRTLVRQLVRSGTSVGANITEAQAASSKKDFINKMQIANKEAHETRYWLRVLNDTAIGEKVLIDKHLKEIEQIINILTIIVRNAQSNNVS